MSFSVLRPLSKLRTGNLQKIVKVPAVCHARSLFGIGKKNVEKNEEMPKHKLEDNIPEARDALKLVEASNRKPNPLTNKRAYYPPPDVEEKVEAAVSVVCNGVEDWKNISLDDETKFTVLTRLIGEFEHDVSNTALTDIQTPADAIKYFQTEVKVTSNYDELAKTPDLPENLHIIQEYNRFDPATDKLHGGVTAYPGHDVYVMDIKYRRKYKDIKIVPEKPGFAYWPKGY